MEKPPKQLRRRGRVFPVLVLCLLLLVGVLGTGAVLMAGRAIAVPDWVILRVQARANILLQGKARLQIGGAQIVMDEDFVPRVRIGNLRVYDPRGVQVAYLPEVRASLSPGRLLAGRIQPTRLRISGASLALRRNSSGQLDLAFGRGLSFVGPPPTKPKLGLPGAKPVEAQTPAEAARTGSGTGEARNTERGAVESSAANVPDAARLKAPPGSADSIGGILAGIDKLLETPILAGLKRVQADALTLTLDDARADRVWQVSDGRLTLQQDADRVSIELGFGLSGGSGPPAQAVMTFVTQKHSPEARISARVDNVAAADIAAQSPALAWLKVVDAPISGDLRATVGGDGQIGRVEGALNVGSGVVRPGGATAPIRFEKGSLAFTYDPATQKVEFSDASVQSAELRAKATGTAYLRDLENGLPKVLLGQVKITQLMVDPEKLFVAPVKFSSGEIDVKLHLDPFELQLGQLVLSEGNRKIQSSGDFRATPDGWKIDYQTKLNAISSAQLLALWPVSLIPQTREWLTENVQAGLLFNVIGALRLAPGAEPKISLSYDFANADVRFIKTLPPIRQGRGYATIEDKTYTMVLDAGHVQAPKGGDIDMAGSVFQVPDIDIKPPPAIVTLKTDSTVTAALSLLDEPPFRFLSKAGQPVDLASGRARTTAVIKLPLADHIDLPDVSYKVTGEMTDVKSDRIVPGKVLTADRLKLSADKDTLAIFGTAALDGLPVSARWTQPLGKGDSGSTVTGTVQISQRFLDAFNIGLPPGSVSGSGPAELKIGLDKGKPPGFSLISDLAGIGVAIPELGWHKPASAKGRLEVAGTLGTPVRVDRISLTGAGLSATGSIAMNANGTLNVVHVDRLKVGNWFDAPVDLKGQGAHGIAIAVKGGTVDLRKASFGRGAARGDAVPMAISLDRLIVSEGMALTSFNGTFTTRGGFNGSFTANVNDKSAPVRGTVVPTAKGTAVRLRADDAGAVVAAAGVSDRGRGGDLDLTLIPRSEPGQYDGRLSISNVKVVRAPAMAELLEAISVVGLIDQLNGPGIGFSDVQADFRLTPNAIEVTKGSAIGPSIGISLAGLYDLNTKAFDMQGVISPIYILNGIGSFLTKKGEGLFGFNYTLHGTSADPRISVNPLSILTPGMFRNLFRAPPPTLPK